MNTQTKQTFKADILADILVVDDTPDNLRLLSKILTDCGYKVRPVTSGKRALDAVQIQPPDLILLDILMPDMDGYEVCRALKSSDSTREIPIVFLTALNDPLSQVKGFKVGCFDYITKPFDEQIVLARIENQLTIHRQKIQLQAEIRHRQQVEAELRHAKELAEQANRAKSVFLANMSHELRTPLNAVIGFAELMNTDSSLASIYQEYTRIIYQSGHHLLGLINDILDLSKIEAEEVDFAPQEFSLKQVIETMRAMFRLKSVQKGVRLAIDGDPDLPEAIETDEQKLRQVLINLLGNAFKFTDKGQVTLRVKVFDPNLTKGENQLSQLNTENAEKPGLTLLFEVIDTGQGIAPEHIQKIFEPFVQTELGQTVGGGTGLGLSISKKYAEIMGGSLQVISAVNRGSQFQLFVPVNIVNRGQILENNSPLILPKTDKVYRVLVVDDEPDNRLVLVELLKLLEVEVRSVENGSEAIAEFTRWHPDLIWMDLRMPAIDGYETTEKIRAIQSETPPKIIAMTANMFARELEQDLIIKANFDDFITKPFSKEIIFAKMFEHLFEHLSKHLGVGCGCQLSPNAATLPKSRKSLPELTAQVRSVMPTEWLEKLNRAAAKCGDRQVLGLLQQIPSEELELRNDLIRLTENFQFDRIVELSRGDRHADRPTKQ